MKKVFSLVLGLSILLNLFTFHMPAKAAGSGTAADPYIITNESEFNSIRNNPQAYYMLNADIVLSKSYIPFEFKGSLSGANSETPYSITVDISGISSYTSPLGLFTAINGAEIKNIALKGKVSGYAYVGGFFGRTVDEVTDSDGISSGVGNSKLENLINYATVSGSGSYVGGIGGVVSEETTANNLINSGAVKAKSFAGGVFASCYDGEKLINNGYVCSTGDYAGGITAELKGQLQSSYNSGYVCANSFAGGVAGSASAKDTIIENCANYGNVEGKATSMLNMCGGLLGGIKRLPDVNITIRNSLNTGNVTSNSFIHSQYLSYDSTNVINVENCFYLSENDEEIAGAYNVPAENARDIPVKLSGFEITSQYNYPLYKGLTYLAYSAPEIEENSDYEIPNQEVITVPDEAGLLEALDIIDREEDYTITVTRGQFADLISRAFLYNQQYLKTAAEPAFSDVDTTYGYYDSIRVLSDLKIMNAISYNRFYPDKEITLNEAVTALVRATGYEIYAKAYGEYPTGYLYQAKLINILNGVEASENGLINLDDAVKLIYNSLFVNSVVYNGVSDDGNTLLINSNEKYINSIHKVYDYDVVITDNGATDKDKIIFGTDTIEITDFNNNTSRLVKAYGELSTLFGMRIKAFVREDGINKNEMIYHLINKNSKSEIINGKNILNVSESVIAYEKNNEDGKSYHVRLNTTNLPVVYINGERRNDYRESDFKSDSAVLYAIDNNGDGYYERLNLFDFDYEVIAGSITENKTIYAISGSAYNLVIDPEKSAVAFVYGSAVTNVSDIKYNDVISVVKTNITKNSNPLYYILVSRKNVEGVIDSSSDDAVYIGDTEYPVSALMKKTYPKYLSDFKYGDSVTLYINYAGEVAYIYNGVTSGKTYGFVLDAGMSNTFEPYGVVKLLAESGEIKELKISEKVKREDIKVTDIAALVTELKSADNLIVYQINSENELSNVIFAKYATNDEIENMNNFTIRADIVSQARFSGYTIGGIGANDTVVFYVPQTYDKSGIDCKVSKNMFVSKEYYSNVKLYDVGETGIASAALWRPATSSISFDIKPETGYVYIKTVNGFHEDFGALKKIYYYDKGIEKSILVNTDVVFPDYNPKVENINSLDDLKTGDYFVFETDTYGNISKLSVVYKASSFGNNTDGEILQAGDGATGTNFMTFNILEGNIQYKSNSFITLRLPGSDYKIEPLNYSSASVIVYKIDRTGNRVFLIDDTELEAGNFAAGTQGDRVVIVANKNNLQEVIIYE